MTVLAEFYVFGKEADPNYLPWIIGSVIAGILALRILAGKWDRKRIAGELEESGCKLVSATWSPFGKGSFGEDNSRTYEVTYLNPEGETIYATVKTSLFTGVFWSGDGSPSRFAARTQTTVPSPPIAAEDEGCDCGKCGFFVQASYQYCPNCGTRRP
ncbi:hypothetical protein QEH56_13810 [Pelagicoccus enzymogenes]|uniref:hypothetical protein n=1 Tax=Pelagicoccus enzymogenes TaxID=2773457 RepID=UPI00280FCD38|nr:hypothetical protein [Pelagicoccus enzymogenes]MDQ8199240.1 hypothetical protein [Pelagicoccus enzymogenes]